MKHVVNIESIHDYNTLFQGVETLHPLVTVINFHSFEARRSKAVDAIHFGVYGVFLKDGVTSTLRYGRNTYDYQEGTLVFVAPGQVVGIEHDEDNDRILGHALLFHPDLIRGTSLGHKMNEYSFFSYEVHEALHISERERRIVLDCFTKVRDELQQNVDKHSKGLIASNIELFLNYCLRFYDRQFITRDQANRGVLERFETLLNEYFQSEKPRMLGQPTVTYCAEELHLSANYFGDLVKKETGKSALDYIQTKMMEIAKERLFDVDKPVSEVAYELGFKYPQHFSRLFKQRVGVSPNQFRALN